MTLAELTTPFERRRVIEYGSDGNKVVRHWYEMQRIAGPLYKEREQPNKWGENEFCVFIFFPGVADGIVWWNKFAHSERYTVQQVSEWLERDGYDSPERFAKQLDESMRCNRFIGNVMIEFVNQWDSDLAALYTKYRSDFYANRREQEEKRLREEKEHEEKEAAEKREKLAAMKALYLGWANDMTPLRFGKVDGCLSSLIRFNGEIMTKRDFVIWAVKNGWMPKRVDGVTSWYGSKWDKKESKPRTEYHLGKNNESYTVSKTEFDFASYIVEHREVLD